MNNRCNFVISRLRMLPPVSLRPHQKRELEQIQSDCHTRALVRTIGVGHIEILPGIALSLPCRHTAAGRRSDFDGW